MSRESLKKLSEKIVSTFGTNNIVCVLLHGSLLFNPHLIPQDVDLIIILKKKSSGDCLKLRELVIDLRMFELPIHLHLIYLEEIPTNADYFSIHTCGSFFVCHLRQAETLFGKNIFDVVNGPSDYHLQLSLLQKVQQYTFQLRNLIFKIEPISEKEIRQTRKRTIVVLKDLLMSQGSLIQEESEIFSQAAKYLYDFSPKELEFLQELLTEWTVPSSSKDTLNFLQQCLAIHEQVYSLMRQQVSENKKCRFFS
ncbi:MAG: hypothetical protein WC435_02390 [Candidatus Paceibacterota bacterium]